MTPLAEMSRQAMRDVLERALAAQGFSVAWDGRAGNRVIAFPPDLPDDLWTAAHAPHQAYPPAFSRAIAAGDAPPLAAEARDAVWNCLADHLLRQGRCADERDHPALRQAGYVIIPLRLIAELWAAAHLRPEASPEPEADEPLTPRMR